MGDQDAQEGSSFDFHPTDIPEDLKTHDAWGVGSGNDGWFRTARTRSKAKNPNPSAAEAKTAAPATGSSAQGTKRTARNKVPQAGPVSQTQSTPAKPLPRTKPRPRNARKVAKDDDSAAGPVPKGQSSSVLPASATPGISRAPLARNPEINNRVPSESLSRDQSTPAKASPAASSTDSSNLARAGSVPKSRFTPDAVSPAASLSGSNRKTDGYASVQLGPVSKEQSRPVKVSPAVSRGTTSVRNANTIINSIEATQADPSSEEEQSEASDMNRRGQHRSGRGVPADPAGPSNDEVALRNDIRMNLARVNAMVAEHNKLIDQARAYDAQLRREGKTREGPKYATTAELKSLDQFCRDAKKKSEDIEALTKLVQEEQVMVLKATREAAESAAPSSSSRASAMRDSQRPASNSSAAVGSEIDGPGESPSGSPVVERSRNQRDRLVGQNRDSADRRASVPRDPSNIRSETATSATSAASGPPESSSKAAKINYEIGNEVAFRPKPVPGREDAEWIKGIVVKVIGDNKTRRYDVRDPEPDDTSQDHIYRTSASSMVLIPPVKAVLADYPKGKQVLAQYPATTTFYRAEVVEMKGSDVLLRFEGEEEANVTQVVDRRFVLDHKGKVGP